MDLALVFSCIALLAVHFDDVYGIRISEKKCEDFRKMLQPTSVVFSDTDEDAAPKEFPFMATIYDTLGRYHNGILISENFVLSTAAPSYYPGNESVVLGDLDTSGSYDDARPRTYNVIAMFRHPDFNFDDRRSDIKLYKLNQTVRFDEYVRPACLAARKNLNQQEKLLEIGWAETNIRSNKLLHKIKLNYVPDKTCLATYKSEGKSQYIKDVSSGKTFCAGANKGDRQMCGGFSGSALIDAKVFDEIIGIASFGFNCNGSSPNVFVRVSAYIDWIESIVWSSEYQKPFQWQYILMIIVAVALMIIVIGAIIYAKMFASKRNQNNTVVRVNMAP